MGATDGAWSLWRLDLGGNGGQSWGTHVIRWEERIAIVVRMGTHGRIALLLTQADEPPLVADELRPLFAMRLAVA